MDKSQTLTVSQSRSAAVGAPAMRIVVFGGRREPFLVVRSKPPAADFQTQPPEPTGLLLLRAFVAAAVALRLVVVAFGVLHGASLVGCNAVALHNHVETCVGSRTHLSSHIVRRENR